MSEAPQCDDALPDEVKMRSLDKRASPKGENVKSARNDRALDMQLCM
jgi:hypothetical protein